MKRSSRMILVTCLLFGACAAEDVPTTREDAGARDAASASDASALDTGASEDAGDTNDAGRDSGAPDSGPDDLASRYCDAYNDFGTMCDVPGAGADCDTGETCVVDALRSDVREPVVLCLEGRECGETDAPCFDIDTFDIAPSAAAAEFTTECMARHEECEESFELSHCGFAVLSDATIARYARCIRTNCAGINSCVGRIVGCIDEE